MSVTSSQRHTIPRKVFNCFQSTKTEQIHRPKYHKSFKGRRKPQRVKLASVQIPSTLLTWLSGTLKVKITCAITTCKPEESASHDDFVSSVPLSYAVQIMHFWVQSVNKESQEIIAILKTMFWMLDEQRSLGELLVVIHVLFV